MTAYVEIVKKTTARSTGATIALIDNRDQKSGLELDVIWETACETHGYTVGHTAKAVAISWMAEPETWCGGCRNDSAHLKEVI